MLLEHLSKVAFFFKEQKELTIYWLWFCFSDVSYWEKEFVEELFEHHKKFVFG